MPIAKNPEELIRFGARERKLRVPDWTKNYSKEFPSAKPEQAEAVLDEICLNITGTYFWALMTQHPAYAESIAAWTISYLKDSIEGAEGEQNVKELSRELQFRLGDALKEISFLTLSTDEGLFPYCQEGMFWLDYRAARVLEQYGEIGKTYAVKIQEEATARWADYTQAPLLPDFEPAAPRDIFRLWYDTTIEDRLPIRFPYILAEVLWRDIVCPRLEKERQLKAPAATQGVLALILPAHFRKERRVIEREEGSFSLLSMDLDREREVARIERTKLEEIARRYKCPVIEVDLNNILKATRTITAQRVLRDVALRGFKQKVAKKEDYRTITIVGGILEYARLLGIPPKMRGVVSDVLTALELVSIPLPHGGHDGLLAWSNRPAAPGRRAEIQIILRDPLLPGYMFSMPETTPSQRFDRRPVPIPELLPPTVGSPQFHAAEAVLQLLTLRELSKHAGELYETGYVTIDAPQWGRLADEADVPRTLLPDIREAWTQGQGEEAPAFLVSPARDRYTLADPYAKEREMILETGQWMSKSSERGEAGAKKRWASTTKPKKKR